MRWSTLDLVGGTRQCGCEDIGQCVCYVGIDMQALDSVCNVGIDMEVLDSVCYVGIEMEMLDCVLYGYRH